MALAASRRPMEHGALHALEFFCSFFLIFFTLYSLGLHRGRESPLSIVGAYHPRPYCSRPTPSARSSARHDRKVPRARLEHGNVRIKF